jgi:DNA polymerase III delta prime subunit
MKSRVKKSERERERDGGLSRVEREKKKKLPGGGNKKSGCSFLRREKLIFPPLKMTDMLLVDKYKPRAARDIIGNQSNVAIIRTWLQRWRPEQEGGRGLLITGGPGSGKSSSVAVLCRELGIRVIECNASDTRNSSSIEQMMEPFLLQVSSMGGGASTSAAAAKKRKPSAAALKKAAASMTKAADSEELDEDGQPASQPPSPQLRTFQQSTLSNFFKPVASAIPKPAKTSLCPTTLVIFDEVDGLEGNSDRGGLSTLCNMIARTGIPIVCIGNDCSDKRKFGTLQAACQKIDWAQPTPAQVLARITVITREEHIKADAVALKSLVEEQRGDIRQILNELQFWAGGTGMAASQKDVAIPLFDLVRGGTCAARS